MSQHGDDLDDDFVPDDIVALSDDDEISLVGDADDIVKLLSADEDGDEDENRVEDQKPLIQKKRKRREKEKERKLKKRKLAEAMEPEEQLSVAAQPPTNLAEYLAAMQAKAFPKMSAIELQDRQIPGIEFHSGHDRMDGIEEFGQFSGFYSSSGSNTSYTLVSENQVSWGTHTSLSDWGSFARRALDPNSQEQDLDEHVAYLKKTKVGTAVGTPGRVGKLLCDTDALSVSALTHIMLDVSYRDTKKRSLLDIPETRDEVFKTVLGAPQVVSAIQAGKIQIVLF
ncbi:hypothetical protein EW146_g5649 [Bondarzewia mesenterica]|uniref:Uncharacterized protein n=1 Tax=Bondarzewia mesenterica TaxID=1095465 RepID=A0A4S4LQT8_9AGAM|nr:hypothetical protein EW146_g5649 [Bondarzewia mesenterica]